MMGLTLAWVTALGLVYGSFTNVLIYRLPAGKSLVSPGSSCPACGHQIRYRDNIPVLSWLLLGGRCRDCRTAIPVRYPIIELVVAAGFLLVAALLPGPTTWSWMTWLWLWALWVGLVTATAVAFDKQNVWWRVRAALCDVARLARVHRVATIALAVVALGFVTVWTGSDPALWPAVWVATSAAVVLSVVDLTWQRLPFAVSVPATVATALLLLIPALVHDQPGRWVRALICAAAVLGGFLVVGFAYPSGMGGGDVVLAPLIGLLLGWLGGWPMVLLGLFAAALLGAVIGASSVWRRRGRHAGPAGVPFGPFLFAGVLVAATVGPQILAWYGRFLG